ncbi:MAG: urease accessory protein UreE [Deltaproteobacteria bacterium]|nr:urease accessory protein UreE [Deltaproteobacteria bacterium]
MVEIIKRIERRADLRIDAQLPLTYESRQKRWLDASLSDGENVHVRLPRGESLRGGELLVATDGRVVEVVAAAEIVVQASFATPEELTRAAYHLGNRHAPTQVCAGFLRIHRNHVLEAMLKSLGANLICTEAVFEPEAGAYSSRHSHGSDGAAKIHEYGNGDMAHAKS